MATRSINFELLIDTTRFIKVIVYLLMLVHLQLRTKNLAKHNHIKPILKFALFAKLIEIKTINLVTSKTIS